MRPAPPADRARRHGAFARGGTAAIRGLIARLLRHRPRQPEVPQVSRLGLWEAWRKSVEETAPDGLHDGGLNRSELAEAIAVDLWVCAREAPFAEQVRWLAARRLGAEVGDVGIGEPFSGAPWPPQAEVSERIRSRLDRLPPRTRAALALRENERKA